MTGTDGDADKLRVPPWLTGTTPSRDPVVLPAPAAADETPVAAAEPPAPVPAGGTAAPAPETQPHVRTRRRPVVPPGVPPDRQVAPDGEGRHAASEPSAPSGPAAWWRPRLIVAGVATAVSLLSVLLVPALLGEDDPARRAATPSPSPTAVTTPGPAAEPPAGLTAAPASPTQSASLSAEPSPSAATPTTGPPRTSPPPKFGPVTFEAEASGNTLGGSAWVDRYPGASGGSIVRNIGDWNSRDGDGVLRFQNINVPVAGTYTLRLFHVNIDGERTRTAVITVAGQEPRRVTLNGGSSCCTGSTLKVQLRKGGNTITIANSDGHAPSVDRLVLSLP